MTVETDMSCEVSYCSCSDKVELEENSTLDLDLNLNVSEDHDENVCDDDEGEGEGEGEGENDAYVLVGGGGEVVADGDDVAEQEDDVESVEEKDGEELHEGIDRNVESVSEVEHVDDDGKNVSVDVDVDDDNVEIVDDEERIVNKDEQKMEYVGDVERSVNTDDDVEKIEEVSGVEESVNTDDDVEMIETVEKIEEVTGVEESVNTDDDVEKIEIVEKIENAVDADDVQKIEEVGVEKSVNNDDHDVEKIEIVEKIENVNDDGDDNVEEEMKLDTLVEVEYVPSELDQDKGESKSGETDLVAETEIKDNQGNEKSDSCEDEVEKQVSQVVFTQNYEFDGIDDDVLVDEFIPLPSTKEDGMELELETDSYLENTESIRGIDDSNGTPHESSVVKGDVDSTYLFVDGTEAVSNELLEAKPAIGNMTNLGSVTQTEERQNHHHFPIFFGTMAFVPSYDSSSSRASSGDKVSPCCSDENAKPDTGMASCFPDQSGYLPAGSSSELERNEAVDPVGDVYLESEVGTGPSRSTEESTLNSCGDTSERKKGEEKMEKKETFRYLIKFPRYFDHKVEEQIVQAQQQVEEATRKRDAIIEEVQAQKATCNEYRDKFEAAKQKETCAFGARRVKRQEIESVQSKLNRIKSVFTFNEIGDRIRSMEERRAHETIHLKEEKQLLKEMKILKLHHQQLRSDLDKQAETQPPEDDQSELLEQRLKIYKKELGSVRNDILRAEEITKAAKKEYHDEIDKLRIMQERFRSANILRQQCYARVQKLKTQLYEKNKYFRMYKEDAWKAEEYSFSKDREALNSHCVNQVEKFMELWNKDDDFRNEYLRLNRRSMLRRLHTSKVLALVDDEPVIPWKVREKVGATPVAATDRILVLAVSTSEQEESVSPLEHKRIEEKSTVEQNQNHQTIQLKERKPPNFLESSAATVPDKGETEEKTNEANKQSEKEKELARMEEEAAAAKIREQLLLEERAKAKEAEERKRRNAEKTQARAELKAQKEAEQKEKERAKREKKKAKKKNAKKVANQNEPSGPIPETTMPEPTTQEPEVEEKPPKVVPQRKQRPSVLPKQARPKFPPLPPTLRNKNKKRMQPWMWILLTTLIVAAAVVFLPNLQALYNSVSKG